MSCPTSPFSEELIAGLAAWPSSGVPFVFPWPTPGDPGKWQEFQTFEQWRSRVEELGLAEGVPLIISAKYERAQTLLLMSWINGDVAKAAELVALTALELALTNAYGREALPWAITEGMARKRKKPREFGDMRVDKAPFAALLKYMVEEDGLTDDKLAIYRRCGGPVIGLLTGATQPGLAEIRNAAAHGDPFDGLPRSGLIELCRDLIEYSHRHQLASLVPG